MFFPRIPAGTDNAYQAQLLANQTLTPNINTTVNLALASMLPV